MKTCKLTISKKTVSELTNTESNSQQTAYAYKTQSTVMTMYKTQSTVMTM